MVFLYTLYCFKYITFDRFGLGLFLHASQDTWGVYASQRGKDDYLIFEIVVKNYCYCYSECIWKSSCLRPFPKTLSSCRTGKDSLWLADTDRKTEVKYLAYSKYSWMVRNWGKLNFHSQLECCVFSTPSTRKTSTYWSQSGWEPWTWLGSWRTMYQETETYVCSVLEREGQGGGDLIADFNYIMWGYREGRAAVF